MIVHGFGVAHAHIVLVPLEHPWDITAALFAVFEDGQLTFRWQAVALADRADLDAIASTLQNRLDGPPRRGWESGRGHGQLVV